MIKLKPVNEWFNQEIQDSVSGTLYYIPNTEHINVDFWIRDRNLLIAIFTYHELLRNRLNKNENKLNNALLESEQLMIEQIIDIFDKEFNFPKIYEPAAMQFLTKYGWKLFGLFQNQFEQAYKNLSRDTIQALFWALPESLRDYSESSSNRKYLAVLHEPNNVNHVYMTMVIRHPDEHTVEHRHIMHSVYAMFAPCVDKTIEPIPQRISLIMHSFALQAIGELHPKVDRLYIEPLKQMLNILVKAGYASEELLNGNNGVPIIVTGKDFDRLKSEAWSFVVQKGKSLCVQCQINQIQSLCGACLVPMYCSQTCANDHFETHKNVCKH